MTARFLGDIKKIFLSLLMLTAFSISASYATDVSGNLNQPMTHVVSVGINKVIVDNVTGFQVSDTILLIQMQGIGILTPPDNTYGSAQGKFGEPGLHEFLVISSINSLTKEIIFTRDLLKVYDPKGNIQIIRVPSYKKLNITGTLFCDAWSPITKTGGVLAFIVERTVNLSANIDVSGKGFTGGAPSLGDEVCRSTDDVNYGFPFYDQSSQKAGYKGEGIAIHDEYGILLFPTYAKGFGPNYTGGGGGNGNLSGGGGGSNRGIGGDGGKENCGILSREGGSGGFMIDAANYGGIFMGGGGGASTGATSQGGNGGGIVIIIADEIIGNGGKILANGSNGGTAADGKGSGGGGAGGSIALSIRNYGANSLTLSAIGGRGGDNPGSFGEGGGGGGGLIYYSTIPPITVSKIVDEGKAGNDPSSTGTSGTSGELRPNFKAVLNGFLFNSIVSAVSKNQQDSICSGLLLPKLIGTEPVGGSGPGTYTYIWRKSYKRNFSSPILLKSTTNPADKDYTPTLADAITPTDTVFFKRTIQDTSPTQIIDSSNWVKFTVHPKILNNLIVNIPDTICINTDPQLIKQGTPDLIVPTTSYLKYIWQDSTIGGTWGATLAPDNLKEFDPNPSGGLPKDTWYRRTVLSGACVDMSGVAVVKVLPVIADNAFVKLNDTICFGGNTNLATITGPTGGLTGKYKYQWESSTVSSTTGPWTIITGETFATYDPDASVSLPVGDHFYRRIVYSGELNTCQDITPAATRKVWPVVTNNKIKADQTIGYDSIPAKLVEALTPSGGDGTYKYFWQKATALPAWSTAPGDNLSKEYSSANLQTTTWFRRRIRSSVCASVSDSVKITVDALITNTIALANTALDTIYTGSTSSVVNGSIPTGGSGVANDYAFQWYKSIELIPTVSGWTLITGATSQNFNPGVLTQTTFFKRYVSSPKLIARATIKSDSIKVEVLPKIQNFDITANQTICSGDQPAKLLGNPLISGGDSKYRYTWQDSASLTGWADITSYIKVNNPDYTPPVLTSETRYRRIVYSGKNDCASETSKSVKITVNQLPTGSLTNTADTTICGDAQVILKLKLTGAPGYKITYNDGFTDGPANIPVAGNSGVVPVNPFSPSALNTYTYKLVNVTDQNGCIALISSLNGTKKANVYKVPVANAGDDDVFCGPKVTLFAVPSVGTGIWTFPASITMSDATNPNSDASFDPVLFTGKDLMYKFVWEETNWQCKNKDSVNVTFDRPVVKVDAGKPDTTFYTIDNIIHMTGNIPEAWETGTWSVVAGSGIFANDTVYNTTVEGLGTENTFKWKIENGECNAEDNIIVYVSEIVVPLGISPNGDKDNYNEILEIKGLDLQHQDAELRILTGSGSEVFYTYKKGEDTGTWKNWDGKNSRGVDLPDGTYYFVLKLTSKNPGSTSVHKETGYIILKRNRN